MRRLILAFLILGLLAAPASAATIPPGGTFVDDDGNIFEPDIEAIAAVGVTKGCNSQHTSFCPTSPVTRGQMAAFLVRALGLTAQDPAINFTDDNSSIFENDIEKLATAGITKGCGNTNTFCPSSPVTRGQMAAFLTRGLPYVRLPVPARGTTTNGIDLAIAEAAADDGCTFAGGTTCLTTITIAQGQFFYFDEGFLTGPWSQVGTVDRNNFMSNQVRTEAKLNGTKLGVVVKPVVIADDIAEKVVTFQFPNTWTGTHQLDITFISEPAGYQMTIRATVVISSSTATATTGLLALNP